MATTAELVAKNKAKSNRITITELAMPLHIKCEHLERLKRLDRLEAYKKKLNAERELKIEIKIEIKIKKEEF